MVLKLTNNVSKKTYEYAVNDLNDSKLYYHFDNFVLAQCDDGEYNYELFDNDEKLVAKGVLQVGNYNPEHKTYKEENNKTYKQYQG